MTDPERMYWIELTIIQFALAQHANRLAVQILTAGSVKKLTDRVRPCLDRLEALAKEVEA